ncbi:MAG: hypothetical protein QW291_06430 [Thermofilaceae archaeon]
MHQLITLKDALKDFLKDAGLTLQDLLSAMNEEPSGIIESIMTRIDVDEHEAEILERLYAAKQLNLLLLVIQVFYLINPSGYYKGFLLYPPREKIIGPNGKVTKEGLKLLLRSLDIVPHGYA